MQAEHPGMRRSHLARAGQYSAEAEAEADAEEGGTHLSLRWRHSVHEMGWRCLRGRLAWAGRPGGGWRGAGSDASCGRGAGGAVGAVDAADGGVLVLMGQQQQQRRCRGQQAWRARARARQRDRGGGGGEIGGRRDGGGGLVTGVPHIPSPCRSQVPSAAARPDSTRPTGRKKWQGAQPYRPSTGLGAARVWLPARAGLSAPARGRKGSHGLAWVARGRTGPHRAAQSRTEPHAG